MVQYIPYLAVLQLSYMCPIWPQRLRDDFPNPGTERPDSKARTNETPPHVILLNNKTCLLVEQEDMPSCSTGRRVFLFDRKTCLLVRQEDLYACSTRRPVFLHNKMTCLLVRLEDMSSCVTGRHVFDEL